MPTAPARPCPKPRCRYRQPCPDHKRKAWDRVKRQPGGNGWAWQRIRNRILERDGYRCRWCGADAEVIDHIVGVSAGGSDDPSNLVAACRRCNERRRCKQARGGQNLSAADQRNRCGAYKNAAAILDRP